MKNNNTNPKPWLDPKGRVYSDDLLKELSKGWDAGTWDQYLSDQVDNYLREDSISPKAYDHKCETQTENGLNDATGIGSEHSMSARVREAIRKLTKQQQNIIRCAFWKDLSIRETGAELGISTSQVFTQKKRSLNRLNKLLASHLNDFRLNEGPETLDLQNQEQTREEQIREVYNMDCKGSVIK